MKLQPIKYTSYLGGFLKDWNLDIDLTVDKLNNTPSMECFSENGSKIFSVNFASGEVWDCVEGWKGGQIPQSPLSSPSKTSPTALAKQVGGNHYKDYSIQPIEFFIANQIPFAEASICKYILRHRKKNGKEDLLKARHLIDILLEKLY